MIFLLVVASLHLLNGQSAIHPVKQGSGTAIIFLPGFTTPGSIWNPTIANLEGTYETHVISYAGFNGRAPIDTPWYAAIKKELIDYVREERLRSFVVIGHSMGGNLATELAVEFGNEVAGLILVDALPCMRELMMPDVPVSALAYDNPYNQQILGMNAEGFRKMARRMAANMTTQSDRVDELTQWALQADRKTYVYGYTDLLKLDLRPDLEEIVPHTLILGTTFPSREMTQNTFEQQYARLSNKKIELADNSRHFIMLDQPEWFYAKINAYLATDAR